MHINIEIKARCKNQKKTRKILKSMGSYRGIDRQIDTYFNVPSGRLKLRQGNIENYLIFYERENTKHPKQSNVELYSSKPNSSLKKLLEKSLGVLAVVDKKREIYWIDNVKFHLDDVKGLGKFMEIEAIDYKGNIGRKKLLEQCRHYMELFKISRNDLISCSYSDLLLKTE